METLGEMPSPVVGKVLRRARLLRGIKQSHLAEVAGVTQGTVSRWESGTVAIPPDRVARVQALLAGPTAGIADAALKRLVETSSSGVHLICDRSHTLLAASPARRGEWRADPSQFLGRSLIVYATPEILAAEAELGPAGWHEGAVSSVTLETGANDHPEMRILPGRMIWERLFLADGSPARLVTSIA